MGEKRKRNEDDGGEPATGERVPKSLVFSRERLPAPLKTLQGDLRRVMLPYTALKLKEKRRNTLKDFMNVAGPMGVTHFIMLSKRGPKLRVCRTPQGPTITFRVREYRLASDVARSQLRPRCPHRLFAVPPLIVLSGFAAAEQELKRRLELTTVMFRNMFPAVDVNSVELSSCRRIVLLHYDRDTDLVDFAHYSVTLQRAGVSRRLRRFVRSRRVPDLGGVHQVADFLAKGGGFVSESEAEEEPVVDVGRAGTVDVPTSSAVRLHEIGPRMTLQLARIEEGLCSGDVIFAL